MKLYTKISIGLVAGILVGWLLNANFNDQPFNAADTDQNGTLTLSEIFQAGKPMEKYLDPKAIRPFDANQDGLLSLDEIIQKRESDRITSLQADWETTDLDGDGMLRLNEILVGSDAYSPWRKESAFAEADTQANGFLSRAELLFHAQQSAPDSVKARFTLADLDKDGNLKDLEIIGAGKDFRPFLDNDLRKAADLNGDKMLSFYEISLSGYNLKQFLNLSTFGRADKNGDLRISFKEEKSVAGWQSYAAYTDPIGKIFIRLVKLVVVPLVLASLILGAANLGDVKKLGKIGAKTFLFFTATTAIAVTIGILAANVFQPGNGLPPETRESLVNQYQKETSSKVATVVNGPQKSEFEKIVDIVVNMVPTNPIQSLAEGDMLAIIFFAIFFGICLTLIPPDKAQPFLAVMDGLNEVVLKIVTIAMEFAPYGVFALILGTVADMGIDILLPLLKYGLVVAGALLAHLIITHFSVIALFLRMNPLQFIKAIKEAILLGFSTSSSSATLPISMNVAQKNLGVSPEVSSFVLPLGATINMDGTALYQGVAAIFIAQVYDIDLTFGQQAVMVLTATLASIGAAGVPGAGMITLAVVLGTANIPIEGIALIFGLDRLLDMLRTTINIVGDLTCSAVMAKSEGESIQIQDDRDIIPG